VLPDGRRLAFHDLGDPRGVPAVYLPGTPTAGSAGRLYDGAARRAGVRLVSLDKPGYGGSSAHPGRALTDVAGDVRALLDDLGVQRAVAIGESGGGPHALALGAHLADRISKVVLLAGVGLPGPGMRRGMKADNRILMLLAARSPLLLSVAMRRLAVQLADPRGHKVLGDKYRGAMSPADLDLLARHPQLLEIALEAAGEALHDGGAAAAHELRLLVRRWDFAPREVRVPVHLWHGARDRNVPPAAAAALAAKLPDARLRLVAQAGHSVGLVVVDDVMAEVVA
jgi:pimeloyl-ACP methyl ester carboxylesterase